MILDEFQRHRDAILISMKTERPNDKENFIRVLRACNSLEDSSDIEAFAVGIEAQKYHHGKLSNAQYMAHPYRVAQRIIEQYPGVDKTYIKLALCHNIKEVAGIDEDLFNQLGPELVEYVDTLTVDRQIEWDQDYKRAYYLKISEKKITRIVKIFDKLDNLFVLSENSDKNIKLMYLAEIEEHLMPFVKLDLFTHLDYFQSLIDINYSLIGE